MELYIFAECFAAVIPCGEKFSRCEMYINISRAHSEALLSREHVRYLGVTRRAIYPAREHRKHIDTALC